MIIVICGRSGAGKTTLKDRILKNHSDISPIITYTTRALRPGEVEGVDYHFVTEERFNINEKLTLKRSVVVGQYGVDIDDLANNNQLTILDVAGIQGLCALALPQKLKLIFLQFSTSELISRLLHRGDTLSDIQRRLGADEDTELMNLPTMFPKAELITIKSGNIDEVYQRAIDFIKEH